MPSKLIVTSRVSGTDLSRMLESVAPDEEWVLLREPPLARGVGRMEPGKLSILQDGLALIITEPEPFEPSGM